MNVQQTLVNNIGIAFATLFDLITLPFDLAKKFIDDLLNLWSDNNLTFIEKLGSSFLLLFDSITEPFKMAMKWIGDKFNKFMDKTLGGIQSVLNFFGADVDLVGNTEIDYGGEEYKIKDPSLLQKSDLEKIQSIAIGINSPNVPSPNSADNRVVNNNQEYKTAINIHTTDTVDGVKKGLDSMERQIEKVGNNSSSSWGS